MQSEKLVISHFIFTKMWTKINYAEHMHQRNLYLDMKVLVSVSAAMFSPQVRQPDCHVLVTSLIYNTLIPIIPFEIHWHLISGHCPKKCTWCNYTRILPQKSFTVFFFFAWEFLNGPWSPSTHQWIVTIIHHSHTVYDWPLQYYEACSSLCMK